MKREEYAQVLDVSLRHYFVDLIQLGHLFFIFFSSNYNQCFNNGVADIKIYIKLYINTYY